MRKLCLVALLMATVSYSPLLKASEFDDAKSKAEKFISRYEQIRSLYPKEVQALVKHICGYDGQPNDFESLAQEAKERMRDEMRENIGDLISLHEEAISALKKVEDNPEFKDKQSETRSISERVEQLWLRVEKIYGGEIRGGNHPVIAYMRKMGQESHRAYQEHFGECTVSEFETGKGPADCLSAEKCYVIEVKPNNSRAVSAGREQAQRYARALDEDEDGHFTELTKRKGEFESCKGKFQAKVATYVSCPNIKEDGEYETESYGFSEPF